MLSVVPVTRSLLLIAAYQILACALTLAQSSAPIGVVPRGRTASPSNGGAHQQPCWQQVGISSSAIEQRRSLEQSARAQVESVCADSSLTSQQKREKIKEIHQHADQQIGALITPQQIEALKACNAARATNRPPLSHPHPARGTGPCGEMSSTLIPVPDRPAAENPPGNADELKPR